MTTIEPILQETIKGHQVELKPIQNGVYRVSVTNGKSIQGRIIHRLDVAAHDFHKIVSGLRSVFGVL